MNFITSIAQGQEAPQNITTGQSFLFLSLYSWERYGDSKADCLQRDPYSKRAEKSLFETYWKRLWLTWQLFLKFCKAAVQANPAGKFYVTKSFVKRSLHITKLSLWFARVHTRSKQQNKSALHRRVCIIATPLGTKL